MQIRTYASSTVALPDEKVCDFSLDVEGRIQHGMMLEDLESAQGGSMSQAEMQDPRSKKYWKHITSAARTKPHKARKGVRTSAEKAVRVLCNLRSDLTLEEAQAQVVQSMNSIQSQKGRKDPIFPRGSGTKPGSSDYKVAQARGLQEKIDELERCLEFERQHPPHIEDPGRFQDWLEKLDEKMDEMNRPTKRAMWRKNRKIAYAAAKNETARKKAENEWLAEMHEMEQTIYALKAQLERHRPDDIEKKERLRGLSQEKRRLRQDEKQLKDRDQEVQAALSAMDARKVAKLAERKARESKKKDEERLEAGHRIVQWESSIGSAWRWDIKNSQQVQTQNLGSSPAQQDAPKMPRGDVFVDRTKQAQAGTPPSEPTAEMRLQQLRDISRSISYLKKFAAVNQQHDQQLSATRKVEEMLRALEKETLGLPAEEIETELASEPRIMGVEEVGDKQPAIRYSHGYVTADATEDTQAEQPPIRCTKGYITVVDATEDTQTEQPPIRYTSGHNSDPNFRSDTELLKAVLSEEIQAETPSIRYSNSNPNSQFDSRLTKALFSEANQPEPPRSAWPAPQSATPPPRTLSEQLKAQLSTKPEVRIDDDLNVNVEAEVPELQTQIFELSQKLKKEYPLMDTLPYDVWTSKKRKTLQTWLKILIRKWQMRNEDGSQSAEATTGVSTDVRGLLDQMVLDHDLSRRAAKRMVRKWAEVFERREARKLGIEQEEQMKSVEDIDWDEMEDAGMGWLKDESESADEQKPKATAVSTNNYVLPEDLPFSWKKGRGYRRGAADAWVFAAARGYHTVAKRRYSVSRRVSADSNATLTMKLDDTKAATATQPTLPHLTPSGSAHMVSVSSKPHTVRTAIAVGSVHFSNPTPLSLIRSNTLKKGDVLSVSRIAGIMAAKKCPDLIPLCHPIVLTHVGVDLHVLDGGFGGIGVEAKVQCEGQTGVEMEALTGVVGAALSVVDMCKAVDKGMMVQDVRVVLKEGGRSGAWREEGWKSLGNRLGEEDV